MKIPCFNFFSCKVNHPQTALKMGFRTRGDRMKKSFSTLIGQVFSVSVTFKNCNFYQI